MNLNRTNWKLDHIGIAVKDLEYSIQHYRETSGMTVTLREKLPSQGVELVFLNGGSAKVELLAPLDSTSTLARFIEKRGTGLHHVCYEVSDIAAELAVLAQKGVRLIDVEPRHGAAGTLIAFIHPSSCEGVLTELCQYPESVV